MVDALNQEMSLKVVLITGMSGAGRSTVLKAMEDLGYEAIDNLPLSFVGRLVDPAAAGVVGTSALAISVDFRTREFDADTFAAMLEDFSRRDGVEASVLFLDCDDEILARRFTETRRRHPLDDDRPIADCIRLERERLQPVATDADMVIDTTAMSARDLARLARERFAPQATRTMVLTVLSFSYRLGLPREADLVFDVRFLSNPHYDDDLRLLTGRDAQVGDFIRRDPACQSFLDNLTEMLASLLPHYQREGKSYLTVAIGCTGGRHRSVFIAEQLAERIRAHGRKLVLRHRDLESGPST